jgi:cellulase
LPENYNSPDIACHFNSKPAAKHVELAAGDSLDLTWKNWPSTDPHPGVFLNYLAPANSDWTSNVAGDLKFFKISEQGYDPSVANDDEDYGLATGSFKAKGKVSTVTIPESIAPGSYVLRHEIIALHEANEQNGAQNYPMCINIQVSGSGTVSPPGIPASSFYKATDPGILVDIYDKWDPSKYQLPGPPVFDGSTSGPVATTPTTGGAASSDTPTATKPSASASTKKGSKKGGKGSSAKLRRHARDLDLQ